MRLLVALLVLAALAPVAHAQEMDDDPCGSSCAQPGFTRRANLTGTWGGRRTWLEDRGVTIAGSYAIEAFGATAVSDCCAIGGVASLSLDVDLSHVARHLGALHVVGFGIHGGGLSERIGDHYGVSNLVAPDDVRLFEAWYEQPLGKLAVRAGLLAADQEFVIARHGTVLMDATFGVISQFSDNLQGPVYPVAAPGISTHLDAGAISVRAALYDADLDNVHGMPTSFGHRALAMGEIELDKMMKVGGWAHTDFGDGLYAVIDHGFGKHVGAFARGGVAPGGEVSAYGDLGVRLVPSGARRHDFAGVGLATMRVHDMLRTGNEVVGEATYEWYATGWLTVQPDVQVVFEPARTSWVGALRTTVAL